MVVSALTVLGKLERASRTVLSLLESELPDALDQIAASWEQETGDIITVAPPATFLLGVDPSLVESDRVLFPIVTVGALTLETVRETAEWGLSEGRSQLFIHWYVAHDERGQCPVWGWRYGEAVAQVLGGELMIESGVELERGLPDTSFTPVMRAVDDYGAEDQFYFVQMGEMNWGVVISG